VSHICLALRATVIAIGIALACLQPRATAEQLPSEHPNVAEIVRLINQERAKAGLPGFNVNDRLAAAATFHINWMRQHRCYEHRCLDEPDLDTRVLETGYDTGSAGENLDIELRTPQAVVADWLASPIHYANIFERGFEDVGCAYLEGAGGPWWTCVFGREIGMVSE